MSLLENYCPHEVTMGPGQCWDSIKMGPSHHSPIHSSVLHPTGNKVSLEPFLVLLLTLLILLLLLHNPLLRLLLTFQEAAYHVRGKVYHG